MGRWASCARESETASVAASNGGGGPSAAQGQPAGSIPDVYATERQPPHAALQRRLVGKAPPLRLPAVASASRGSPPRPPRRLPGAVLEKYGCSTWSGGAAYTSGLVQARGTVRLPCARVRHHPGGRHRSPEPCGPRRPRGAAHRHHDGTTTTNTERRRRRGRRVLARANFSAQGHAAAHEGV